jgi:hypothetical protein
MFFVEFLNYHTFKTFTDIFSKFTKLTIVLALSFLEGTEGSNCILNSQQKVSVVGSLIGTIDETQYLGEALLEET